MSQDGTPPEDPQSSESEDTGRHSAGSEPTPDNPYPQSWDAPRSAPPPPPTNPYAQEPYAPPDPYGSQNPYGTPGPYTPSDPYGQPSPYAAPGAPGSPANPYPAPDNGKPTFGFGGYAGWFTRVGAYLIDYICGGLAALPAIVGYVIFASNLTTTTDSFGNTQTHYDGSAALPVLLIVIGAVTGIGWFVWNICIRQGRTGASVGKSVLAVRLVNADMQPIGAGWSFLRYLLHIVDGICYIGYLWPIWDSHKQTFADKIVGSYVIQATTPPPPAY